MRGVNDGIGFIGLGSQGGPMAGRILEAGMPLIVWARRPDALVRYTEKGARSTDSIAELGTQCRHVGICVVDDAGVLEICDQLIPAMAPGSLIAVHSTILPETVMALDMRCRAQGIHLVDAPVSGGGDVAAAGKLTVMCGATSEAFALARPVFDTFGQLIVLLGSVGAGQQAKIVNNALLSAHLGMAWAAISIGEALGLDRAMLTSVIAASSGRSYGFELAAQLSSPAQFGLGTKLLIKDLNLLHTLLPDNIDVDQLRRAASGFLQSEDGALRLQPGGER